MGSLITLSLGKLELDWGKFSQFRNHSVLFRPSDQTTADYFYADNVIEQRPAFVRRLGHMVNRLDLLGYTMPLCRKMYDELSIGLGGHGPPPLDFDQFAQLLHKVNVNRMTLPEYDSDYDLGEFAVREILCDAQFVKNEKRLMSLSRDDGTFFENLDPYVVLRLLAENARNRDLDVVWRVADVVEEGWLDEGQVYVGVSDEERILVVTEGSTDGAILKRALPFVAADIEDFFEFVDMSENYPFTGTGNLVRFCQGLARIKIQNRILFVLDNDTAGRSAFEKMRSLSLPRRMRIAQLPALDECRAVRTLGPSGARVEDVNGRAVSIEWFLETIDTDRTQPTVRWTAFNEALGEYQGELVNKDAYTRRFFESSLSSTSTAWAKLTLLWKHLLATCVEQGVS